jgi:nicotinate phosphoribosyltransferase
MSRYPGKTEIDLFDNDKYKFVMQQAVLKLHPFETVKYELIFRDEVEYPFLGFLALKELVSNKTKHVNSNGVDVLSRTGHFTFEYLDFLRYFHLDPDDVEIWHSNGKLHVEVEGYWWKVIHWEVILMSLISEFYYIFTGVDQWIFEKPKNRIPAKVMEMHQNGLNVTEMGTRRRFSERSQVSAFVELARFQGGGFGVSNVKGSEMTGLPCFGSVAHEWYMFNHAKYGTIPGFNMALKGWLKVNKKNPGYVLPDTLGTDAFLEYADPELVKKFCGFRQDSGDPIEFLNKIIKYYEMIDVDHRTKSILFSDGLNIEKALLIKKECDKAEIPCSFGIGTNFTNDIDGVKPLNMVIKMTEITTSRGSIGTVKLSDSPGKEMGKDYEIERVKSELGMK